MRRIIVCVGLGLAACSSVSAAPKYRYVAYNGAREMIIDYDANRYWFQDVGSPSTRISDLGGAITDCGKTRTSCVSIGGKIFTVPEGFSVGDTWRTKQVDFKIVAVINDRGNDKYLIECSHVGDVVYSYSYSEKFGIDTISINIDDDKFRVFAITYLVNGRGILSSE